MMLFLVLVLATLVSEDLACISGGLFVVQGRAPFALVVAACMVGILIGDIFLYLIGRWVGRSALRRIPFRWFVREAELQQRAEWFRRRGPIVLWITRFVPGSRLPTYLAAGLLGMGFWRFTLWLFSAGAVWTPLLVGFAVIAGNQATRWIETYQRIALPGIILTVALAWVFIKLILPLVTWRGRRLLLSRWRRLTQWEFWPLWIFYLPIVIYIFWLGFKHRALTLFTAANPGMPAGGLLGESKSGILRALGNTAPVAAFRLVTSVDELTEFPVVLKPDVGQRGLGVAIIRTRDEAVAYFRKQRGAIMAQEYLPGFEFGVFYYRRPNDPRGHIFSVTEKRFPSVIGDGVSTLETLILRDDRAVCMARYFLKQQAGRLDWIPPAGESVPLAELGTHCRGSLFLDGAPVRTAELETAIDEISRGFHGFYIGRYDIRTPSVEDFKAGRNFKIIELNGVTSEATHIYQPGYSVFNGWRTIMRQWRIAFEIAAENRSNGSAPASARRLLQILTAYTPAAEA